MPAPLSQRSASWQALFRIPSAPPPVLAEPERWGAPFAEWLELALRKEASERASASELRAHAFTLGAGDGGMREAALQQLLPPTLKQ